MKIPNRIVVPEALPLFDTHAHLDFEIFHGDFDDVLARAREAGLQHIVTIGASGGFGSNQRAIELAERLEMVYATVGIHPHQARLLDDDVYAKLTELAAHPCVVAIGETGLDYFYDRSARPVQRAAFRRFVGLAREVHKPLVVHTRDAEDDTIAILRETGAEACDGIIHCFSGTQHLAAYALEIGFHLSFSGIVTFPSAPIVQEVARECPIDRILVETDAPYLAPTPLRGQRNEPAFVNHTARFIAKLRGMAPEDLAEAALENGRRLFGINDN